MMVFQLNSFLFIFTLLFISFYKANCLLEQRLNKFLSFKNTRNSLQAEDLKEIIDPSLLPKKDDKDYYYLSIFHTTDIHGTFYEKPVVLPSGEVYSIGGMEYLAKYITTMRSQWGDQFLYLDSGDQFQGGLESSLSDGRVILDALNYLQLNKSAVGNHEFDFDIDFLKKYMGDSKFEWLMSNVKNKTSGSYITFPNQKKTELLELNGGEIKVGVIGLLSLETPESTDGNTDDLQFEYYLNVIIEESKKLREQGANAIIVLGHVGLSCKNDGDDVKLKYLLRDKNTEQKKCGDNDEVTVLLNQLPAGTIDLFLGGHKHDVAHHWINGVPVVSSDRNGKYAAIVYLPFDRKTKKVVNDKIQIEGPLPICEKVFSKNLRCDITVLSEEEEANYGKLIGYKFHGVEITKEASLKPIADKHREIFDLFNNDYLTKTNEHFESFLDRENALGDFYTDFLRHITGSDFSVISPGCFRTPFYRGNITNATIYSFDPFMNNPVKFKIFGWEVKKMMKQIQGGTKGFYPVSGLRLVVKKNPKHKLIKVTQFDGLEEKEIIDDKEYTMTSIIYDIPIDKNKLGGDDFKEVSRWFKPHDPEIIKVGEWDLTRDMLIEYLRNVNTLKTGKYFDKNNPRMRVIDNY